MIVGNIIGGNFLTTNSTNFHEWGAASPENFIIGFIRVHSFYSWLASLQPRTARSLLTPFIMLRTKILFNHQ
jgi:hypothetical protein